MTNFNGNSPVRHQKLKLEAKVCEAAMKPASPWSFRECTLANLQMRSHRLRNRGS